MQYPILIIAHELVAVPIAETLHRELNLASEIAPNRRAGLATLRRGEYSLILLDEGLATADTDAAENLYRKALATPIIEMNFGISTPQRVMRQVRAAIARRAQDHIQAREAAIVTLQSELRSSLTSLLLESQLALREAPPSNSAKLRHLVELAGDLRSRLCA